MNQNLFELQRAFSDSVLQTSCLNPNLYWAPTADAYQPVCDRPIIDYLDQFNDISAQRTMSLDNTSRASRNYILNVQEEQRRLKDFRSWENVVSQEDLNANKKNGCIFTLMSYNVLAQILLNEHRYLYRKHDSRALNWNHRSWALMQEFLQHNADILCLQEVQLTHIDFYNQLYNYGYKGIFKSRTGVRIDGCALYYKDNKLDLLEYTTLEYYQPGVEVLNRENVAIIARFAVKNNPSNQFVVATTHLLYNPRRQDVRLAQTQLLLAEVDRIAFSHVTKNNEQKFVPVIITGDFNLMPFTPVYNLLTNSKLEYEHLSNRQLKKPNELTRRENSMGKVFLSPRLGITDYCQHAQIAAKRTPGSKRWSVDEELGLIKLEHSERGHLKKTGNAGNLTKSEKLFSTGKLAHHFNLMSVYSHGSNGSTEATTHQEAWISVDYIFYSGDESSQETKKESNLKLISRYRIPSAEECKKLPHIPNLVYGSDHLSLAAKFLLEYN